MKIREAKISDIDNLSSLFNSYRMFYGKDSNIKVAKKFLEVGLLAGVSLIIIISIYKRETSLRTKAEKATILANNATKAKI